MSDQQSTPEPRDMPEPSQSETDAAQQQPPQRQQPQQRDEAPDRSGDDRVVVVTPEGMGVAEPPSTSDDGDTDRPNQNPAELVEQPAKVMRIGSMVKQLLEEVRSAPLDEAGRARLAEIHDKALAELKDGLAPELDEELDRLVAPFKSDQNPSDAELRIAQAQLVGWLEGLFQGIQTALVAQQMAAQAQLQQMRALPPGHPQAGQQPGGPAGPGGPGTGAPGIPGMPGGPAHNGPSEGTGQYL
ncbi:uncharacterized protein DUF2587 [Knoellia remsis]|uniref:Bacterial proteasome activator n=1 Tax=Knoellia remsis TaxID=407159 RepID=A0A2T0UGM8_9MICO|nr:proteasome activator [Knoellia remsis]PRY57099.1 uncharacterized protein DUF2587 [Knoellia remsis]